MSRYVNPVPQYYLNDGSIASSGKLYFYENKDPNTKKDTFNDSSETIKNTNPVLLDGEGRCPPIFGSGRYTVVFKSNNNIQQWSRDDVDLTSVLGQFADWSAIITYRVNDIVRGSDGNYYASITNNNIGNDPLTSQTLWEKLAFLTFWNASATYNEDDIVISGGDFYRSVGDGNIGNQPESSGTNVWADTSQPRNWLVDRIYFTGDLVVHNEAIWSSTVDSNTVEPGLNPNWRNFSAVNERIELTGLSSTIDSEFNNTYWFAGSSGTHTLTIDPQIADEGATETRIICDPRSQDNLVLTLGASVTALWSMGVGTLPTVSIDGYVMRPGETVRLVNMQTKDFYLAYPDNGISSEADLAGGFDASQQIKMSRIGNIVTIISDGVLTHPSSSTVTSAVGVIPEIFRSNTSRSVAFTVSNDGVYELNILSTGTLSITYYDWTGSPFNRTSTAVPFTITYDVFFP